MNKFKEKRLSRIGESFGKLTIIDFIKPANYPFYLCVCKCKCGNLTNVTYTNLKNGSSTSCGCNKGKHIRGNAKLRLFNHYKMKAKRRGKGFDLTFNQFISIVEKNCHYCNFPPSTKLQSWSIFRESDYIIYSGVDRRDSSKGYELDNCVPCCEFCNRAKNDRTEEEFLNWLNFVKNGSNTI